MTRPDVILAPLPARWRLVAELLLSCRRFSADTLLLAAEAFDECAQVARFQSAPVAAAQARALADRLRAMAPERAARHLPPFPCAATAPAPLPSHQEHLP